MNAKILKTFFIVAFYPLLTNAQVVFEDDFSESTLDTSKWTAVITDGAITQDNDELIFSKTSEGDGWDLWAKNYVTSVESFPRSNDSKLLRITIRLRYEGEGAMQLTGLFPEGEYQDWETSLKYGFHENHGKKI